MSDAQGNSLTGSPAAAPSAPAAPAFVTPTDGMSPSQVQAAQFLDSNRAAYAKNPGNFILARNYRAALDHAFRDGPAPSFLQGQQQPGNSQPQQSPAQGQQAGNSQQPGQPVGNAEAVGLDGIAAAALAPASPDEIQRAVSDAAMGGLDRTLAGDASVLATQLQLSAGETRTLMSALTELHGASPGKAGDVDLTPIPEADFATAAANAAQAFGGMEKLQAMSATVREFLAARGVLDILDKQGVTNTTAAFNPRVLFALAQAAARSKK